MIPEVGERYQHTDGSIVEIRKVDISKTFEVTSVEFVVEGRNALFEANAEGWRELAPQLTKVPVAPPAPSLEPYRFRFVERLVPDLKVMQAFGKSFSIGAGSIEAGYIGTEPVTVLVGIGDNAALLKQLGLRIYQHLKSNGTQDPQAN